MKTIEEQISGKIETPEEKMFSFYAAHLHDSRDYVNLVELMGLKSLFNEPNFLNHENIETHALTHFNIFPTYIHHDVAYGKKFRRSVEDALPYLKEANKQIIELDKNERPVVKTGGKVLWTRGADNGTYLSWKDKVDGNPLAKKDIVDKLKEKKPRLRNVNLCVLPENEIKDRLCLANIGAYNGSSDRFLFSYTLTPREELTKSVRLFEGHEQRTYNLNGTSEQLDVLEGVFSYLQYLGEVGHSSGVTIGYDGDGGARMSFERADGQALCFPFDKLKLTLGYDSKSQAITPERFKKLAKSHKSFSWKNKKGKRMYLHIDLRDDEASNEDVAHFVIS